MGIANFIKDLGRPVAYYPELAKIIGVKECIFVCQLLYWLRILENGNTGRKEVYKTRDELRDEIGFSFDELLTVRRRLIRMGILVERAKRLEHKMFYSINEENLNEIWENGVSQRKSPDVEIPFVGTQGEPSSSNTEITSEITEGQFLTKPAHPYPQTEEEMYETLEENGIEIDPDHDGDFFNSMEKSEWTIKGKPVHDWIKTYESRLSVTSPDSQARFPSRRKRP